LRPLDDWDETDLAELVTDQVQEGLQLDYKASGALAKTSACMSEISKDVSAFANSAGGRIIYGITEVNNLPAAVDKGSDPAIIINSRIQPRIGGVRIKPIPLASGGLAFVIDIPQATTFAPHQADNHRYYRRFNFHSVPMEDYEIKDAMRRSNVGAPYIRLSWASAPAGEDNAAQAHLKAYAGNRGSEPIMYALVRLAFDERLIPEGAAFPNWEVRRDLDIQINAEQANKIAVITRNVMPANHMPFFKETEWLMFEATVPVPPVGTYFFSYEFTAPGVDTRSGGLFRIDGYEVTPQAEGLEALFGPRS
jgi:hypothetical protein